MIPKEAERLVKQNKVPCPRIKHVAVDPDDPTPSYTMIIVLFCFHTSFCSSEGHKVSGRGFVREDVKSSRFTS